MAEVQLQLIPIKPGFEPGKIYYAGFSRGGDILRLPPDDDDSDKYFIMVSPQEAGVIEDSLREDNWFNGFAVSASALPDGKGWAIYARSDHTANGNGPGSCTAHDNISVSYMIVRIKP